MPRVTRMDKDSDVRFGLRLVEECTVNGRKTEVGCRGVVGFYMKRWNRLWVKLGVRQRVM